MSKEDLLKDLEELAAALKANAERAADKTETASLNLIHPFGPRA